jgi:hypothetical protein
MVVSAYRYITYKNAGHPEHARFRFSLRDDDQRLLAMIEGGFAEDIIQFLPWLSNPSCLLVRFENLVGPAGGGTEFRQIATLQHMRDHLGLPELDQKALQALAGKLFSRTSRTFSVGRSGAWRKYFKKQHEEAFNRRFHGIMSALRYE